METSVDGEPTVWFVDDDPLNNLISTALVQKLSPGTLVNSHLSAQSALAELRESSRWPQVIFLDLNMPECDGWEFLERFSDLCACRPGHLRNQPIQVVILSSSIQDADVMRAMAHPAVAGYLCKPLSREQLISLTLEELAAA